MEGKKPKYVWNKLKDSSQLQRTYYLYVTLLTVIVLRSFCNLFPAASFNFDSA